MSAKNKKNHATNKEGKKITTVKIYRETKERLDKLKEYKRETYDDVLRKVLFILNFLKKDPTQAQKILNKIDSSHKYTQKPHNGNKGIPKDTDE